MCVLGTKDASVVDEDVDITCFLRDLVDCGGYGGDICNITGYGCDDACFWSGWGALEGFDGIVEDVGAAAEEVDFGSTILIESCCYCKAEPCIFMLETLFMMCD